MGFRFRKSIKILPGVKININKKSSSITFGTKGAHHTINSKGKRTTTVGIPGTGLSYTTSTSKNAPKTARASTQSYATANNINKPPSGPKWYTKTWCIISFLILFFPVGIFLMWKYANWKCSTKVGITICFLILMLIAPKNGTASEEPSQHTESSSVFENASTVSETQAIETQAVESQEETIWFHRNREINDLINLFNESFSPQILQTEVGQDYSYQTFINTNGINIRISSSDSGIFVDLKLEDANTDKLYSYYSAFAKCLVPEISDDDLIDAFDSLKSGDYKNYNYLKYNGLQSTYSVQKLNNGTYLYVLKTEKRE